MVQLWYGVYCVTPYQVSAMFAVMVSCMGQPRSVVTIGGERAGRARRGQQWEELLWELSTGGKHRLPANPTMAYGRALEIESEVTWSQGFGLLVCLALTFLLRGGSPY